MQCATGPRPSASALTSASIESGDVAPAPDLVLRQRETRRQQQLATTQVGVGIDELADVDRGDLHVAVPEPLDRGEVVPNAEDNEATVGSDIHSFFRQ